MVTQKVIYKDTQLKIRSQKPAVSADRIYEISHTLNIVFPKDYLEFIELGDKIWLDKNCIEYIVEETKNIECTYVFFLELSLNAEGDSEFLLINIRHPEFFPNNLIAFAQDGGGNYICFDYREGKNNPNPSIVIWEHEADIGRDVSFIAKDFDTFIRMLKSDDEL